MSLVLGQLLPGCTPGSANPTPAPRGSGSIPPSPHRPSPAPRGLPPAAIRPARPREPPAARPDRRPRPLRSSLPAARGDRRALPVRGRRPPSRHCPAPSPQPRLPALPGPLSSRHCPCPSPQPRLSALPLPLTSAAAHGTGRSCPRRAAAAAGRRRRRQSGPRGGTGLPEPPQRRPEGRNGAGRSRAGGDGERGRDWGSPGSRSGPVRASGAAGVPAAGGGDVRNGPGARNRSGPRPFPVPARASRARAVTDTPPVPRARRSVRVCVPGSVRAPPLAWLRERLRQAGTEKLVGV